MRTPSSRKLQKLESTGETSGIQGELMPKRPTAQDAQIIMRLYDLRREAEMRKARSWYASSFWPKGAAELVKMVDGSNPQENAWFRQINGYWEMAASFVLRGALNEDLFYDSGGEMWFVLAKIYPYLKEAREKANAPTYFSNSEKLATRSKQGRDRLQMMMKRVEARRAAMAARG
jgi:hypothetical protein